MKWRKIEDEKPEPNQHILARDKGNYYSCYRHTFTENIGWNARVDDYELSIAEWMPIEEFENAIGKIDTVYCEVYIDREYYPILTGYPPEYEKMIAHNIADELIKKKKIKFTTTKNDGRHNGVLAIRGELTVVDPQRES